MNKRITSLLLCFVMVFAMLATAVPTFALSTEAQIEVTIEPDKTEAHPGDTITYTVYVGPVKRLQSVNFTLVIPDGLTYIVGDEVEGLEELLGADKAEYTDSTKTMIVGGGGSYNSTEKTALMTFTCTVKDTAVGTTQKITFEGDEDFSDDEYETYNTIYNFDSSEVSVTVAPIPAEKVEINKETLSLKTGESETLTATLTPSTSTDPVVWSSSNPSVAAVDATGKVTAAGSIAPNKTATATITATAGSASDTCVVTVNCAHNYTAETKNADTLKTAGTCTDKAVYYYSCANCGEVENNPSHTFAGEKDASNHGAHATTLVGKVDATCQATGYTGDTKCTGCSAVISTGTTTDMIAHTPGAWVTTDADKHWKICSVGGEHKVDEGNHVWVEVIDTAPTYTQKGVGHDACNVCGATKNVGKEIPMLTHAHDASTLVKTDAKASTCTVAGNNAYYTCSVCSNVYKDQTGSTPTTVEAETLPLAAHEFTVPQHDDTQHWNKCANCDAINSKENHCFDGIYEKDAENHWDICAVCGFVGTAVPHFYMNDDDMFCDACDYDRTHICKDHLTSFPLVPATEDEAGTKAYYKCECGKLYLDALCTQLVEEADLIIPKLPKMLEGKDSKWTKGSTDGLTFRSDALFAELEKVMVDNADLAEDKYTKAEGSTIITLKPAYLETLAVGNHTIAIVSENGTATANFTVEAAAVPGDDTPAQPAQPDKPSSPQTGDNSNIFLWVALMFIAGAGVAGTAIVSKKKKDTVHNG